MTSPRLPSPEASHALLIGVHAYAHLENLPAVANNLTGFAATLKDKEIWGLPAANVTVLSQPKDRKAIVDGIIDANRRASDTLLIYYSGHGMTNLQWSEELYLGLPTTQDLRTDTAFPFQEVRRGLRRQGVMHKQLVVILDCCFSARALRDDISDSVHFADLAADVLQDDLPDREFVAGHAVLTATHSRQTALALPGATYSKFTGALMDVLAAGLPGKPDVLDIESLYVALRDRTEAPDSRPELRSRGQASGIGITRNRSPQRTPTAPGIPVPSPPPPPQRTGVPARMAELVREYLERLPWTPLEIAKAGVAESRALRKARAHHRLGPFEELIAVWPGHRLAITSEGLRRATRGGDLLITWQELPRYHFGHAHKFLGQHDPDVFAPAELYALTVSGPRPWASAPMPTSAPEVLAGQLNHIARLAGG